MLAVLSILVSMQTSEPQFVDLSQRTEIQRVIDREPGQYLGHVSSSMLSDGKTVFIAYPRGHGKGPIVLRRSDDGGLTWTNPLPVPENWATSQETPTIHRVSVPGTDRDRLILWSGLRPARIAHSDDGGATWTPLRSVGGWGGIVVMGFVKQRSDGTLYAMFHDDGRFFGETPGRSGFTLYETTSPDGGMTWSYPHALWNGSEVHLCEPGLVPSPNGDEWTVLLRENRRVQPSHQMVSRNEGRAWTDPLPAHPALTGDRHTAKYLSDGRLFITFRDMRDGPTKGDWVAWVGTYQDLRSGAPGQYRVRLMDNQDSWDCAYPGL
ncbi:MAG: exo-alpha-sialidase, partial [Fimbriimonadaceae bacterium]|nr:exo-alpha-sialidase [Fimbriimonadaceae bacterium]